MKLLERINKMDLYSFVKEIKYEVSDKKHEANKQLGQKMDRYKIKEGIQKCLN